MSFIVLFNGHAASGKTTLAYGLAPALGAGLVTTSVMGSFVADRADTDFMTLRNRRYHRALDIADGYLKMGIPVVMDGTYSLRRWRSAAFSLAQRRDVTDIVWVTCSCSNEAELTRRFSRRASNPHLPDADAKSIAAYHGSLSEIEDFSDQEVPSTAKLGRIEVDSYTGEVLVSASTPLAEHISLILQRIVGPNRRKNAAVAIAFEGIGGSGKSTQSALLRDRLTRDSGGSVHYCAEFSNTPLGNWIQESREGGLKVAPKVSSGLAVHCTLILDWLLQCSHASQAADCIILDTGWISQIAHMQALRGTTETLPSDAWNALLLGIVESTNGQFSQLGRKKLTFFLDCPVNVAVERIRIRHGRVADSDRVFLSKLRDAYEAILADRADVIRVDAVGDERQLGEIICDKVMRVLTGR